MVIFGKVYWYTGKWKYELNFILYFHRFGMIHFFNIVTFFLEVEFVNLFKEVLWICHAWTVPKLIRWPRTSSWLCGCFQAACLLCSLVFIQCFFFFSHSSVLDDDHWTINWKRHKRELKQWMMFSFLSLWQQYGQQNGFYSFCPARAYTMLWFGHFHHSWQMEWKNKASLKKWMNKWWVFVKNKDSVDIYSWCTVIGSLCRYHHLKGIKGTKQ